VKEMTNSTTYRSNDNKMALFWMGLLLILLLRSFYFGITYFNYLDDYNTYGIFFRRNANIFNDIVRWYGLYTFRPIAFLSDAYITQWFWPVMWLVLLFYTVMHFFTVYIFHWILKKSSIRFGIFGIIIATLTPILIEAVYWIGASTRLVPGMFFSILSVFFLMKYLLSTESIFVKGVGRIHLILYFVFNIISTGFYEQIIVFNFAFTLLIIMLNYSFLRRRRKLIISVPFISTIAIGLFYIIFWNRGKVSTRGTIASSMGSHFVNTTRGVVNLLTRRQYVATRDSLVGFIFMDINIIQIFILLLVIAFTIWLFVGFVKKSSSLLYREENKFTVRLIMGILLTILPFAPFYVLQNNHLSFRLIYPSIFGIAIVFDTILDLISNIKISRLSFYFVKPAAALLIIPLFMANVGLLNDYRLIEKTDITIATNFLDAFRETGASDEAQIFLFDSQILYTETATNHLENVSSSDWAMLGIVNSTSRDYYFARILPVREDETWIHQDMFENEVVYLGINEDLEVFELTRRNNILFRNEAEWGRLEQINDDFYMFTLSSRR